MNRKWNPVSHALAILVMVVGLVGAWAPAAHAIAPCCGITGINLATGVVTAEVNTTGQIFQFKVTNASQLRSLKVGQRVYANFKTGVVSLDGIHPLGSIINPAALRSESQAPNSASPTPTPKPDLKISNTYMIPVPLRTPTPTPKINADVPVLLHRTPTPTPRPTVFTLTLSGQSPITLSSVQISGSDQSNPTITFTLAVPSTQAGLLELWCNVGQTFSSATLWMPPVSTLYHLSTVKIASYQENLSGSSGSVQFSLSYVKLETELFL